MKLNNLLSFKSFNESFGDHETIEVYNTDDFMKAVRDFCTERNQNILNDNWRYDDFSSMQADSKLPCAWANNNTYPEYSLCVMHDDYDNTGWAVVLFEHEDDGSGNDIDLIKIENLEIEEAWDLFAKIAGKENARTNNKVKSFFMKDGKVSKGSQKYEDINDWLEKNPLYKSQKLKPVRKIGVLDENVNHAKIKELQEEYSIYSNKYQKILGQYENDPRIHDKELKDKPENIQLKQRYDADLNELDFKMRAVLQKIRLEEEPILKSDKLQKAVELGIVAEALDVNDPILVALRAKRERDNATGRPWGKKLKKVEISKEDKKAAVEKRRNEKRVYAIKAKISRLKEEVEQLMSNMENDPNVEAAGGKYADEYGKELNKLEKQIAKHWDEIAKIENPVLASTKLAKARKIGVFDKDDTKF